MPKQDTKRLRQHHKFIDCLRALACIAVIAQHSTLRSTAEFKPENPLLRAMAFAGRGWLGVSLFLVISGLCLYLPITRSNTSASAQFDARTFFSRRALRILPPYYVALVFFSAIIILNNLAHRLPIFTSMNGPKDFVIHALMIHNLFPHSVLTIDAPFWSLALEAQLYLTFPFIVRYVPRIGFRTLLPAIALLSAAMQLLAKHKLGPYHDWSQHLVL